MRHCSLAGQVSRAGEFPYAVPLLTPWACTYIMTDQEFTPLTVQLAKGLADRIPDKRKAAALEVEKLA